MMNLEDLEIYRLSMEIGERIWQIVDKWAYFPKDQMTAKPSVAPQALMTAASL